MEPTLPVPAADESRPVRRLTRSSGGRWFAGVCSGLGRYFGISPTIYRLAFVALALAGGTGLLLYLAAWLVIPDDGCETSIAEDALRDHSGRPALAVGVGLLGLAAIVGFSHAALWPHPGNIWLAALLVGGGLIWWELRGRQPATAGASAATTAAGPDVAAVGPPRRQSLFLPVIGFLLAAGGVLGLLEALDAVSVDWRIALGAAVAIVGAAIVAGGLTERRVAGLAGLGLLLLPLLLLSLAIHVPLRGGVGDRTEHPLQAGALDRDYRLAIGNLTLDLRDVALSGDVTRVTAKVGIGQVVVDVPAGVELDVVGRTHAGDVVLFGSHESGLNVERRRTEGSGPQRLVLDLEVGIGNVEVRNG